ncbi:MAG TPA: polysaccharide deacetylase family protein, partial [Aestuariivirgaceae bacterium]
MIDTRIWQPVLAALDEWRGAGLRAPLWLRDDDAVAPSPSLDRLVSLTERFGIPLALAVVPAMAGETLAARLAPLHHVTPIVHGWIHKNHAPADQKKQEFGPHRPLDVMENELSSGLQKMDVLFGDRFTPMFVPPWNRIAPELAQRLAPIGYTALSTFGRGRGAIEVPVINTHVDIIDFRGARRCRDHRELADGLADALRHSLGHDR